MYYIDIKTSTMGSIIPQNPRISKSDMFLCSNIPQLRITHLIIEDVRITVHIWSFSSKMSKLLFTSENNSKVRPKYSKTSIKSWEMIDFLHRRHYDRFYEYVENFYEKFGKNLEKF